MRNGFLKKLPNGLLLYYTWFPSMHSRVDLMLCGLPEESAALLADKIQEKLFTIETLVNRFDEESELSLLNRTGELRATPELFTLVERAVDWYEKTDGYFDAAFRSEPESGGMDALELDREAQTIRFKHPGVQLDLGGYAKGYGLDAGLAILKEAGVEDALFNFGNSSVGVLGRHPLGQYWTIGVEAAWKKDGSALDVALKPGQFLTTSGNSSSERRHIVDPVSGEEREGLGMVSVVTLSGEAGEALSTALFAAPPDEKKKIALLPECLKWYEVEG